MARTARSVAKRQRHKKWLNRAKGYRGRRSKVFKLAKEAVLKAGQHAYHDRRKKKGDFRRLWQTRINAAARTNGVSYSQFIHQLKEHGVTLDRKVLAELALKNPEAFADVVKHVGAEKAQTKEKAAA